MDYNRIPLILKRYSYKSKMKVAHRASIKTMTCGKNKGLNYDVTKPLPWELEVFVLFSIMIVDEYNNNDISENNYRRFNQIINAIRDYQFPKWREEADELLEDWFLTEGPSQVKSQVPFINKCYRYNYIFNFKNNDLDMTKLFKNKFDCKYKDFLLLGLMTNSLFVLEKMDNKALDKLFLDEFRIAAEKLKISREEFIFKQNQIANKIEDYRYCLKLFYHFPLIIEDGYTYLPLPHLIIDSCTTSLLYRLTEGDNSLKTKIGKEVIEDYVYSIINNSKTYEEVISEKMYSNGKTEARTSDVMIRNKNKFLFIENKYYSPRITNRLLEEKSIKNTIERIRDAIIQIYKHMTERFGKEYYNFKIKKDIETKNVFGLVVTFEETFINRQAFYDAACKELGIRKRSDSYNYICSHIKIIDLDELESNVFSGNNLISAIESMSKDPRKTNDIILSKNFSNSKDYSHILIDEFKNNMGKKISTYKSKIQL